MESLIHATIRTNCAVTQRFYYHPTIREKPPQLMAKKQDRTKSERWTRKQLIDNRPKGADWRIVSEKEFDPAKLLRAYGRQLLKMGPE